MIRVEISHENMMTAKAQRFDHPHPRVQLRMEVLWLKSRKLAHSQICTLAGVSPNTLRRYLRMYKEGGIENLKKVNFNRPQSDLANHRDTLENHFREHPVASIPEAITVIEELTGIKRKPTQVRKFLKSMGAKRLKVGSIPSKADPDKQEEFKKEELGPRLEAILLT